MKKISRLIFAIMVMNIVLVGCWEKSAKTKELSKNIDAYQAVVDYALDHCKDNQHASSDDKWLVYLSELQGVAEIESQVTEVEKEFDSMWITDDYVVLWDNETKQLGLLYSNNMDEALDDLKSWYDGMDYEEIDEHWCTVGVWKHL